MAAKSWLGKAGFARWVFTGYGWVITGFLRVFYGFPKSRFYLEIWDFMGKIWVLYGKNMGFPTFCHSPAKIFERDQIKPRKTPQKGNSSILKTDSTKYSEQLFEYMLHKSLESAFRSFLSSSFVAYLSLPADRHSPRSNPKLIFHQERSGPSFHKRHPFRELSGQQVRILDFPMFRKVQTLSTPQVVISRLYVSKPEQATIVLWHWI